MNFIGWHLVTICFQTFAIVGFYDKSTAVSYRYNLKTKDIFCGFKTYRLEVHLKYMTLEVYTQETCMKILVFEYHNNKTLKSTHQLLT